MGKIVAAKTAAIVIGTLMVLAAIAVTFPSEQETPTSPNELLSELASMGVQAQYSDQYTKPSVPEALIGPSILVSGGLQSNNLELDAVLYSEGFLAEFHCQPRRETCVAFKGWSIRPSSPDGLTSEQFSVWRSIRQKLQ